MTPDELFLHVYDDLVKHVSQPQPFSEYQMLGVARLIRQLLLDGPSSVALQVNRRESRRHKLRFTVNNWSVNDYPAHLPQPVIMLNPGLSPASFRVAAGTRDLNLDQFLSWPVVKVRDVSYTVHALIDMCAHVFGGVHSRDPETADEEALAALGAQLQVEGVQSVIYLLGPIGEIVLNGLAPLARAIRGSHSGT